MTVRRSIATLLVATALAGYATVAGAAPDRAPSAGRVVVVADAAVANARVVAALRAAGPSAELRLPRTPTEQLSVTHLFAARGYTIVGLGLSRAIAVDPVERAYPGARFALR